MNYRALVKNKFPSVERLLRRHSRLMSTAVKIEDHLLRRKLKKQTRHLQSYYPSVSPDHLSLLSLAKQHGLFDFQWYCNVQQHVFPDELTAFADYLHKSRFAPVSPGPAFDNLRYQKANLDIYHSNITPIEHYLLYGINEARFALPFTSKWHPVDKLAPTINEDLIKKQKIALCLHVFYADFIDYYAECLHNFPAKVDLFITVADLKHQPQIDTQLASLKQVGKVTVRKVPNRGRNFGPMLVEFAEELQRYDLFCHLHSKKSLYSGREQTQWADYLGEYLLHDHVVVSKAITHMAENPNCGLYYPTFFPIMPDWVNHWLKNKPQRSKIFTDWQLEDDGFEFLAYPVGGMFWAKPQALKQLLDRPYQYTDFPEEPLPNDGSELHALERCLGLLAEKNGFQQLFYYPELGSFTHDKSHIFSNYVCNKEQLFDKLNPFNIISFDVFDTLVRRSHYVPDYAKLKLGKRLVELRLFNDAHQFVEARNQAEFTVRKQKQFQADVVIDEVYQQLAKEHRWAPDQAIEFANLEFAYDLDMIESKDEVVDILNTLLGNGKLIYIISDTYYSEHQIVMMLRKAGVTNGYKLYVSSSLGKRKDNATMWAYLKETLPKGKTFVHVGDNAVADAQIPGDFGLANLHILNPIDKWQAAGFDNPFIGKHKLNEQQILKWGQMISDFGRFPFIGE
jgi:FMN phosphatase YigB (HAD superfamily)